MALSASVRGALGPARELGAEARALLRERRIHRPAPPQAGLVLDVGSGQAPDPRADVVVDRYPLDDFERGAGAGLSWNKPLIVADGQALPFAGAAFSYVIASHVLEHAEDPVRFAAELGRVAPAGFVQVPTRDSELVYAWPFHPWLIDREGDTLRFAPKPPEQPPGGPAAHAAYQESLLARLAWAAHRTRWHHSVHWTGAPSVVVDGERVAHEQASLDLATTLTGLRELGESGRLVPLPAVVRAAVRCPVCRGDLTWTADHARCTGCARSYPVAGGVPVLVAEAAVTPIPT